MLTDLYDIPSRSCDRKGELGRVTHTNLMCALVRMCLLAVNICKRSFAVAHLLPCPAVNEFVKRVRAARIHCLVIGALRDIHSV